MFKFRSQVGSVLPRASFRLINHANIRQSWEECQQRSPLTPCVKALQWSADPWFSSRRPPGSPALMEILWMVFSFIETVGLTERLWDPDVLYGQSQANYLRRKGLQMLFSGGGTDMSINFHSRQMRVKIWKNFCFICWNQKVYRLFLVWTLDNDSGDDDGDRDYDERDGSFGDSVDKKRL